MSITMKDYRARFLLGYDPNHDQAWVNEREYSLKQFREYVDDNNPPIMSDLVKAMKRVTDFGYASLPDLLTIVNAKIYPSKVIEDDSKPRQSKYIRVEPYSEYLILVDTRNDIAGSVNLPSKPLIKLQSINYNSSKGEFLLPGNDPVPIAARNKVRRPNGSEFKQCRLMRLLFKSVKSMKEGVKYTSFLTVSESKLDSKMKSQVKNIVDEINRKVSDATDIDKLIKMKNNKVFINNSYL